MAQIQLKGVTKRYPDGTEAVKAIDLDIRDGEFMILVGPSGCGKSTALRMVAGLEEITDGELIIGGETGGPGLAAVFDPAERHAVRAVSDARLLLVLAPWPGDGHPGARD